MRQYTCPNCHNRVTQVNVAATKRYREEHPEVKPTPIPKPVGGLLFGDTLERECIEAGIKSETFKHTRAFADNVKAAVIHAYQAMADELGSALHQGANPEEMIALQRAAEAHIANAFVEGTMIELKIF